MNHLMESNQPVSKARSAVRCGVSDKLRYVRATHGQTARLIVDQLPAHDDNLRQSALKSGDCLRDGLIWPTEGRFFAPAELRCELLVVGQTKAQSAPRQQTRKIGQMIQFDLISL